MLFIELYARILAKFRSKKAFCQLCGISLEEIGLYFFEPIGAKEHDAAV